MKCMYWFTCEGHHLGDGFQRGIMTPLDFDTEYRLHQELISHIFDNCYWAERWMIWREDFLARKIECVFDVSTKELFKYLNIKNDPDEVKLVSEIAHFEEDNNDESDVDEYVLQWDYQGDRSKLPNL